jgi:hypothetical protein
MPRTVERALTVIEVQYGVAAQNRQSRGRACWATGSAFTDSRLPLSILECFRLDCGFDSVAGERRVTSASLEVA